MEKKLYLSTSKINSYLECPQKYFFENIHPDKDKYKQTVWPQNLFGQIIHKIAENVIIDLKEKKKISHKDVSFLPIFDEIMEKNKKEFKKSRAYKEDDFKKRGQQYTELFVKFLINYLRDYDDIFPELKIQHPFKDKIVLTGVVDLIIKKNSNFAACDFKVVSDAYKYFYFDFSENIQNNMYQYLMWKEFGAVPNIFSFIVVDNNNKMLFVKETNINIVEDIETHFIKHFDYLFNEIYDFVDRITSDNHKYIFLNNDKCKWCNGKKLCEKLSKN